MSITLSLEAVSIWKAGVDGQESPDIGFLPPIQRRRLGLPTRMALHVMHALESGMAREIRSVPIVHATRYGEYDKAFRVMDGLCKGVAASPAAFSQSVHNTPAGLYSIFNEDEAPSTTISAGTSTPEQAFVEAAALLACGQGQVRVLLSDAPLPEAYKTWKQPDDQAWAAAILVTAPAADGDTVTLTWQSAKGADGAVCSTSALASFLSGDLDAHQVSDGRLVWTWKRERQHAPG